MKTHDESLLDTIIVGRVQPRIYAFETGTVPRYLKVGDTYRPLATRLNEWRKHFADLRPVADFEASVNESVFFRDYSVHDVLENDYGRQRLHPSDMPAGVYYSCEFFNEATGDDVSNAVEQIKTAYQEESPRFSYYDATTRLPAVHTYVRGPEWKLRPNQEAAVDAFENAVKNLERTNLLMYAVMRFGKSFTSLECSKRIDAKRIYIVSAKADVKDEWKKTVEQAGNFEGYQFVSSQELLNNPDAIEQILANGGVAVVFLTLQDLQGKNLKEKHKSVFSEKADLLIVDESHFGARAEEYGRVLTGASKNAAEDKRALKKETKEEVSVEEATEAVSKHLQAKVTLHLSGTPYRILMGSEFSKEDIIAFVQFSDIVAEQEAWDAENLTKEQDLNQQVEEWENPYFGFPQMIRFAFHPNESSRNRMKQLQDAGYSFAFSGLLEPKSIEKDQQNGLHKAFTYEREILDLLGAIDGSKDDQNVLGLLDNERVKDGKLCHHIVMVLPYCASCDAMEELIHEHADTFKNLSDYEIINISGHEVAKNHQTVQGVKQAIAKAASEGRKTLTLTVNKMLTGTTVEQWDTMIFLKDTSSPQEYDQAIFRLQNQWVTEMVDPETKRVIKFNMKPQTLLVDFSPNRMFRMQEQKSLIFNANTEQNGNSKLAERLRRELEISPIVTINKDKLQEVEPADILAAISQYNAERSISDETRDIPVDTSLFSDEELLLVLRRQSEFGSRGGLEMAPHQGAEQDLDAESEDETSNGGSQHIGGRTSPDEFSPSGANNDLKKLTKQLQTYYQRILFYALLVKQEVSSLEGILESLRFVENQRLAKNLAITESVIGRLLKLTDPFKLAQLDYKIQNISRLANDESLAPMDRAMRALNKFTRISDSEIRTPDWLCLEILRNFTRKQVDNIFATDVPFLDLSSKTGEFAIAAYQHFVEDIGLPHEVISGRLFSIPTSTVTYEFTRRFYEILDLDPACVCDSLISKDLQSEHGQERLSAWIRSFPAMSKKLPAEQEMKFGAIVGNPPYHELDGGARASAKPIYQDFINLAMKLSPELMSFVIPTKWFAGGRKELDAFRKIMLSDDHISELHDFLSPELVFPETNNRGGICYFLRNKAFSANAAGGTTIVSRKANSDPVVAKRPLDSYGLGIFLRDSVGIGIVEKVRTSVGFEPLSNYVSTRPAFGIPGSIINNEDFKVGSAPSEDEVLCIGRRRVSGSIPRDLVVKNAHWIDNWKVFTSYSNNIGTELPDDNQNSFVSGPGSVSTETLLCIGGDLNLSEIAANNLNRYLRTKFARFLHGTSKVSHHGTQKTYQFVPLLNFSTDSEIDWSSSDSDLEQALADYFGLSSADLEHILSSIADMK
ncbi:Eco57I restriction-modification methylase domain-containing protein [Rothia nasimurium]|uniref:Eco57I restriction-modification methylase domain-containing protein n=1 Tax=Rothia nasimurium TaxID=85336 RepID=UPI001F02457D|nr:Eco57I restriction-modification methylase domain-containing protein [Rothia nasimurium]